MRKKRQRDKPKKTTEKELNIKTLLLVYEDRKSVVDK